MLPKSNKKYFQKAFWKQKKLTCRRSLEQLRLLKRAGRIPICANSFRYDWKSQYVRFDIGVRFKYLHIWKKKCWFWASKTFFFLAYFCYNTAVGWKFLFSICLKIFLGFYRTWNWCRTKDEEQWSSLRPFWSFHLWWHWYSLKSTNWRLPRTTLSSFLFYFLLFFYIFSLPCYFGFFFF